MHCDDCPYQNCDKCVKEGESWRCNSSDDLHCPCDNCLENENR